MPNPVQKNRNRSQSAPQFRSNVDAQDITSEKEEEFIVEKVESSPKNQVDGGGMELLNKLASPEEPIHKTTEINSEDTLEKETIPKMDTTELIKVEKGNTGDEDESPKDEDDESSKKEEVVLKIQNLFREYKLRKKVADIRFLFKEFKAKKEEERVLGRGQLRKMKEHLEKIKEDFPDKKILMSEIDELDNETLKALKDLREKHEKGTENPTEKVQKVIKKGKKTKDGIKGMHQKGMNKITGVYGKIYKGILGDQELEKNAVDNSKKIEEHLSWAEKGQRTEYEYLFENKTELLSELEAIIHHGGLKSTTMSQVQLTKINLLMWIANNPNPLSEINKYSLEEEIAWYQEKIEPIHKMLVEEIKIEPRKTAYDEGKKDKEKYDSLSKLIGERFKEKNIDKASLVTKQIEEEIINQKQKVSEAKKLLEAIQEKFKDKIQNEYKTLDKKEICKFINKFFDKNQFKNGKNPMRKVSKESIRGWNVAKKLIGPGVGDKFPIEQKKKFTHIALDHISKHLGKAETYVNQEMKLSKQKPEDKWNVFRQDLEELGNIRLDFEKGKYYTGKQENERKEEHEKDHNSPS